MENAYEEIAMLKDRIASLQQDIDNLIYINFNLTKALISLDIDRAEVETAKLEIIGMIKSSNLDFYFS